MEERSREKFRLPGVGWLPQELGHLSHVIPRSELVFWAAMKIRVFWQQESGI